MVGGTGVSDNKKAQERVKRTAAKRIVERAGIVARVEAIEKRLRRVEQVLELPGRHEDNAEERR